MHHSTPARSVQLVRQRALVDHLCRSQQAISTAELTNMGFDSAAIGRLLDCGRLVRAYNGVYHCGTVALDGDTALRCALLSAGTGSVLTGQTAAHTLGLITAPPALIHTAIEGYPGRIRRQNMLIRRVKPLPESDVLLVRGLRCTTPLRMLLEFAGELGSVRTNRRFVTDQRILRRALRQAAVLDHGLPGRLERRIAERRRHRGSRILRDLLGEHLESSLVLRSGFETRFFEWCAEVEFPAWETNQIIEGYEVDVLWRDLKVIVELDTFRYHGDYRAFESNRERDTRLQAGGYIVLRFTDKRFDTDRLGVFADLRAALASRGG